MSRKHCIDCGEFKIHKAKGRCAKCYAAWKHATSKSDGRKFKCQECGKVFTVDYYIPPSRTVKLCSLSCSSARSSKSRIHSNKQEVVSAAKKAIREEGRYLPQAELLRKTRISYETFKKYNLSVIGLHADVGIKKPKGSAEHVAFFLLRELIPDLEYEKQFYDLVLLSRRKARFDLYSAQNNLLIEIDGDHHNWNTSQEALKKVQEVDRLKDLYAKSKGIILIRVPVAPKQRIDTDYLLSYLREYIQIPTDATTEQETADVNA